MLFCFFTCLSVLQFFGRASVLQFFDSFSPLLLLRAFASARKKRSEVLRSRVDFAKATTRDRREAEGASLLRIGFASHSDKRKNQSEEAQKKNRKAKVAKIRVNKQLQELFSLGHASVP
uniref:Uncharacterized protein n=1 Tax=Pediastrum duplex TaxID=3105 RepID=A0A1W5RN91_PEDDU|nr:hypothetical protein [Pediastrum duplex]AQU64462.1 hypothetical protein [Pediastrum duplex]